MKLRQRSCKECKEKFIPTLKNQIVCSLECAIMNARTVAEMLKKKEHKDALDKVKPRSHWMTQAQNIFNAYVLLRDKDECCISCEKNADWDGGVWNAGHYIAKTNETLRFDERNVHKQCVQCNYFLHGNLSAYKEQLIFRIGDEDYEDLVSPKIKKKFTVEELIAIKTEYSAKIKLLKKQIKKDII